MEQNKKIKDWSAFLQCKESLLIAPAGHGKTTAIADCLLQCPKDSCYLILTHTHAGIASLREKFKQKKVSPKIYQLETITGFAQRYVLSFYKEENLPPENDVNYFNFVIDKCCNLLKSEILQQIIKISFNGIFVDEYQDCTINQHRMIMLIGNNLPLYLLGDSLQGIFNFESQPLVDFRKELSSFTIFNYLDYPWRWHNGNIKLGKIILSIRQNLETNQPITLMTQSDANFFVEKYDENLNVYSKDYLLWLRQIINKYDSNNLLIIYPSYKEYNSYGNLQLRGSLTDRIKLKSIIDYNDRYSILDAIDSSQYYKLSMLIDKYILSCTKSKRIKKIVKLYDLLSEMHINSTSLNSWIDRKNNRFKSRTKNKAESSDKLKKYYEEYEKIPSITSLFILIDYFFTLNDIKCHYKLLYQELKKCAVISLRESSSMFDAMKILKTRIRHIGRNIKGRCIGTTLLTKGLEFDTVIIYDAHKISDAKNFYVAISRACKKLVIITAKTKLLFEDIK